MKTSFKKVFLIYLVSFGPLALGLTTAHFLYFGNNKCRKFSYERGLISKNDYENCKKENK